MEYPRRYAVHHRRSQFTCPSWLDIVACHNGNAKQDYPRNEVAKHRMRYIYYLKVGFGLADAEVKHFTTNQ